MKYPRVTIITPTLNQGKYIRETLESVDAQDYPNIEHFIMDGGSSDDTLEIVQEYKYMSKNEVVLISGHDKGQADAINKGMALSSGLIVSWLNSDDTLLPGAILEAVGMFGATHSSVGTVYGRTVFVNEDGVPQFYSTSTDWYEDLWLNCHNPIPQPSAFIRREAWLPLDTSLNYFFDWDLWLRQSFMGYTFRYVPSVWSTYRLHPASKTCGVYPVEELERIYRRYGNLEPAVYHRMAEYYRANHQWVHAAIAKGRAWKAGWSI